MDHRQLFNNKSDIYALSRPGYPQKLYQYIASLCNERTAAWDCACGNGQAAADLVKFFDKVYATDISENQIKEAKHHQSIEYSIQSAEKTNFADKQFDLVCVAQALHWFANDAFWQELKRVLKDNGIFAAWGYSWFFISPEIDRIIKDSVLDVLMPHWAPQNQLLWDQYKTINMPLKVIESPTIEMSTHWNLDELFLYIETWSSTRICISKQGDTFLKKAYEETLKFWQNPKLKKKIDMQFCSLIGQNS